MADLDSTRTLAPTPYRRQQAREQGRVAQSQELVSAAMLLGGLIALIFTGGPLVEFLARLVAGQLGGRAWLTLDADFAVEQWGLLVRGLAPVLLPMIGLLALIAVGLHLLQTGFLFLPSRVFPDFSRANPRNGLSRMFSLSSTVRMTHGLAKAAIIGGIAWQSWYSRREELLSLSRLELPRLASFLWQISLETCLKIAAALLVLSILDYLYQRWKFERDLRMTPQEVRDELRNLEGNASGAWSRRQVDGIAPATRVP
jgi:flagellar biosynthetic protein FlhB